MSLGLSIKKERFCMHKEELFENTPIFRALFELALPTVFGQIILVVYNMADTYFVGLTKSNHMLTAVTICMPAFMILTAMANLFGVGGSSVIARALGKANYDRAKSTCAFSFWGCTAFTLIYSLVVYIFINPVINALGGTDPFVHKYARTYLMYTVVFGGFFTSMNALMAHLVRSEGKALHASIGVVIGGVLNIALDPLFMFVILEKGNEVAGAAIATALSNTISFFYYVVIFVASRREKSILNVKLTGESFKNSIPSCVFDAGLPACIMTLAENISYAILDKLMSYNGLAAQTGIGVAKKVNMMAHSIVRGVTQGALPLLGYSYSCGNRVKTKKTVGATVLISASAAFICTVVSLLFANEVIGVFIHETNEAHIYGTKFLRILCVGASFSAVTYTFISFFQAVGHGRKSFVLALLRKGILDIPLMFVLQNLVKIYGIVLATPITDAICFVVSLCLFSKFAEKHLAANKIRKVYNPVTGKNEVVGEKN